MTDQPENDPTKLRKTLIAWQAGNIGYRHALKLTGLSSLGDLYIAAAECGVSIRREFLPREIEAAEAATALIRRARDLEEARTGVRVDPQIHGGAPCLAGTRIQVSTVAGLLMAGGSVEEIRQTDPALSQAGIQAAKRYVVRVPAILAANLRSAKI